MSQKILIVDDDHECVEAIRTALESRDYEIVVARDGNQGLQATERENPDLLILDMMMPTAPASWCWRTSAATVPTRCP